RTATDGSDMANWGGLHFGRAKGGRQERNVMPREPPRRTGWRMATKRHKDTKGTSVRLLFLSLLDLFVANATGRMENASAWDWQLKTRERLPSIRAFLPTTTRYEQISVLSRRSRIWFAVRRLRVASGRHQGGRICGADGGEREFRA